MFADPDRFDVGRDPNPHMAFGGGGPHLCLGLHVARIEIAVMLRELLTRLPDLAPAGRPEPLASNFITGVRTMPVVSSRPASARSVALDLGGAARQRNAAITGAKASTWAGVPSRWRATIASCDAGLGPLAVAADVLLDGADDVGVALGRRRRAAEHGGLGQVGDRHRRRVAVLGLAVPAQDRRPCGRRSGGSPNRLQASAWRATSRSVRRSPDPPTRIGTCSCSGRG